MNLMMEAQVMGRSRPHNQLFLKDLIFDQWRSAYAREPLFQVKCPWVLDVTAVEENHELRTTKFEAISSSLRKLCKVGNWRLIRIGYH